MGHVPPDQEILLDSLCTTAVTDLEGKLRCGLSPQDCGDAFPLAAACLARAGLCAALSADEMPASWKAGAVSVSAAAPAADRAALLQEQAYRLLQPFLQDQSFFFRGVRA